MNYDQKYLKYKQKYLFMKYQFGGLRAAEQNGFSRIPNTGGTPEGFSNQCICISIRDFLNYRTDSPTYGQPPVTVADIKRIASQEGASINGEHEMFDRAYHLQALQNVCQYYGIQLVIYNLQDNRINFDNYEEYGVERVPENKILHIAHYGETHFELITRVEDYPELNLNLTPEGERLQEIYTQTKGENISHSTQTENKDTNTNKINEYKNEIETFNEVIIQLTKYIDNLEVNQTLLLEKIKEFENKIKQLQDKIIEIKNTSS
jgi:hypothetical protein